jgi:integrase
MLKVAFDKRLPGIRPWRLHDLRRTARTLMGEIGIDRDISERILGPGVGSAVERTYDKHKYTAPKGVALAKLADHVERIVTGPVGGNVTVLRRSSGAVT